VKYPLYPNGWAFYSGVSNNDFPGAANWPKGNGTTTNSTPGQLIVTGTAGTNTLTLNSVAVGSLSDYCTGISTVAPIGAAGVIPFTDGTYELVSVLACNSSTVTITPTLKESITSGSLYEFYNNVLDPHLSTIGYDALAAWLASLSKWQTYQNLTVGGYWYDSSGNPCGSTCVASWKGLNGLPIPASGYVTGSTIYHGAICGSVQTGTLASGATASSDANAKTNFREPYSCQVGAGTVGEGMSFTYPTNSFGGQSGHIQLMVGVDGQNSSTPPSLLTVTITQDSSINLTPTYTTVSGLTFIDVKFYNAWNMSVSITLNSSAATAFSVSSLVAYVWPASEEAMMADPLFAPGTFTETNTDSYGVVNGGFPANLQTLLANNPLGAGTGFINNSLGSQTFDWANSNFLTLNLPNHPDVDVHSFNINDYHGHICGHSITAGGTYSVCPTGASFTNVTGASLVPTCTGTSPNLAISSIAWTNVGNIPTGAPTATFTGGTGSGATMTLQYDCTATQTVANANALFSLDEANGITPVQINYLQTGSYDTNGGILTYAMQYKTQTTSYVAPSPAANTNAQYGANAGANASTIAGDIVCASGNAGWAGGMNTSIAPLTITAATNAAPIVFTTGTSPQTSGYSVGQRFWATGQNNSAYNTTSSTPYTITAVAAGTISANNVSAPGSAWTSGGTPTISMVCNNSADAVSSGTATTFATNTVDLPAYTTPMAFDVKAQFGIYSPPAATSIVIPSLYFNGVKIAGYSTSTALGTSLTGPTGNVNYTVAFPASGIVKGAIASQSLTALGGYSNVNSNPYQSNSAAQPLTMSVNWTPNGLVLADAITYASGGTSCANGTQAVTFTNGCSSVPSATVSVSGNVPTGAVTLNTTGSGCSTIPTTGTVATCTGATTFTTSFGLTTNTVDTYASGLSGCTVGTQTVTPTNGGGSGASGTIAINAAAPSAGLTVTWTTPGSGYTSIPTTATVATCTGTGTFTASGTGGIGGAGGAALRLNWFGVRQQ
jgi:hypothetical protein